MLNMNSPTVQAMIQNMPQGIGNMPVYFGNQPTITTSNQPITPYPSPKEMLAMSGNQNIYNSNANIVGGYNPGFDAAFSGYYNPYMGYGSYAGIYNQPLDRDTMITIESASKNGLSYKEQVDMECSMYKKMSQIVSRNIGRTAEYAKQCEDAFDPYRKRDQRNEYMQRESVKIMSVYIKRGDEIITEIKPQYENMTVANDSKIIVRSTNVDFITKRDQAIKDDKIKRFMYLHNNAPERSMDNTDLFDFFNGCAGSLLMDDKIYDLNKQRVARLSGIYNGDKFKELLKNNGFKTRDQRSAVDRYVGRYGIMPNGNLVSPGHDPSVAESFSMDPRTGQYTVTAPNFIKNRLDLARERFIQSVGG